ncbi:kelch domain-containing protein 7A [Brienomyrus brachyistius]|uniref:kelch domain-containing protein 7A n=1 Tax=Brienomyrus brachyistius TaxID=42636 RepID=UPI0020B2A788|nr:kelch domain-containing protein 7A [Brienomyrus brachyistius]
MPIADLLGVQLDMQMLGKLTVSVAAVLLVSWAYRFYNSRNQTGQQGQLAPPDDRVLPPSLATQSPGHCGSCQGELQEQNDVATELGDGAAQQIEHESPPKNVKERVVLYPRPDGEMGAGEEGSAEYPGQAETIGKETDNGTAQQDAPAKDLTASAKDIAHKAVKPLSLSNLEEADECGTGITLSPHLATQHSPSDSGQVSASRPRSPCLLRSLEPCTKVGRELRHDAGNLGTFSSFQSKAAVVVKDGDLLLDMPGDRLVEVRGKIYEYYVESSSESILDRGPGTAGHCSPGPNLGVREGASRDLQISRRSSGSSSSSETTSLLSPITSPLIMRDIVIPPDHSEGSPASIDRCSSPFNKPRLIRKDSYLQIMENSDLQIPCGSPASRSRSPSSDSSNRSSPVEDPVGHNETTKHSLETVAGMNFLQMPLDGTGIPELDSLQGKLDLGNCLQALSLARKYGHETLQQAALKVMSDNYFQVLRDPELYGRLKAGDRAEIQKQRMRGRQYLTVADIDPQDWTGARCQVEELDHPKTSSRLYYYDDYMDSWHTLCTLPREVISKGCSMCTMDNYLFIAVGCEGVDRDIRPSRRVFCYNPVTSIWKEICPMNEARPQCKLVALQGYIYAIGGECLSTVERYDPRTDRWSFVAPLPNDTFAVAHRATACQGELFVSGGTLRYTLLRYNPRANVWRQSLIVGSKERTTEMVALRSFLYRFDISPSLGLSVYRYHTVARLWYECCSRRLPDCQTFQCSILGDVIYCVNRQFNMRFLADEVSPDFVAEDLKVLSEAKGMLFPFILSFSDKETLQTRV